MVTRLVRRPTRQTGRLSVATGIAISLSLSLMGGAAAAQGYLPTFESPEESRARAHEELVEVPAPPSYEPPSAPLGAAGQWVVTNSLVTSLSSTSFDGSQASSLAGSLVAGTDYFLVRNLSIGVDLELGYSGVSSYGADGSLVKTVTSTFAAGPRIGYNVPLGGRFSFYPRATLGLEWAHRTEQVVSGSTASVGGNPTGAPATTQVDPWVSLYAPIDFQVRPHLFLGLGPSVFRDFGNAQGGPDVGAERTRVGVGLELGGDWGGAPTEPAPVSPSVAHGPARRFGQQGEVVITGEVSSNAFWTTYDGTGSSNVAVSFAPGFDYFVVNHVALGVAVQAAYENSTGLDGSATVHASTTSFSAIPRVAVDVPLASWLSLYPRATLFFGYQSQDETERASTNASTQDFAGVGLYVPVLLHVAPHLFVGFGPNVSHELTHSYTFQDGTEQQVRATTFGAALTVGGWL